jgi:hypothetical protein
MPKPIPKKPAYDFVLSELESSKIWPRMVVKPMFGSHALYIDNRIMVILRQKEGETSGDNGIWVVVPIENQPEIKKEFPALRPIKMFQKPGKPAMPTWLNLPEKSGNFEGDVFRIIEMLKKADVRIGKTPESKKPRKAVKKKR